MPFCKHEVSGCGVGWATGAGGWCAEPRGLRPGPPPPAWPPATSERRPRQRKNTLETSRDRRQEERERQEDNPQPLNFRGRDGSSHLLSTYYVQALFILKTRKPSVSPTLRVEEVEFGEANPLGQSPARLSKGTGI